MGLGYQEQSLGIDVVAFSKMISFDVPSDSFQQQQKLFEERYKSVLIHTMVEHPFNFVVPRVSLKSKQHLKLFMQCIIDNIGEGVILQQYGSPYEHGRSHALIKLKTSKGDAEAVVVARGNQSTFLLRLPGGSTFIVPSDNVCVPAPSVGDVVTFSFDHHARREIPVNPKILRIRTDMLWEEVVHNYYLEKQKLNEGFYGKGFIANKPSYWALENRRNLFIKYAKQNGLDLRNPENWYLQHQKKIMSLKGASTIAEIYGGLANALIDLFPNIGLSKSKFPLLQPWQESTNRRKFFENYAKENGFDPQKPENWYSQPLLKILSYEGANQIKDYYGGIAKALINLFPNIGLHRFKFPNSQPWQDSGNRRKFFENYAKENGFDPQNPENWYSQPASKILSYNGASRFIFYYHQSVAKALIDLFPDIKFDLLKFPISQPWQNSANRRKFFENYAEENGFDPKKPSNWYLQPLTKILSYQGAPTIAAYHGGIVKALLDLFPRIGLERSKFPLTQSWQDSGDRRRFFENYAKENGFDPQKPENWYSQPLTKILSYKGASRVIAYHGGFAKALDDLFPNIGLDRLKFPYSPVWQDSENRRKFFENYAKENGFDLHNAENWYSQSLTKILSYKGAHIVAAHHGGIAKALVDLFPKIGLDQLKFSHSQPWQDRANRRKFFENYAKANGFNLHKPENWYSQPVSKILSCKGARTIREYHGGIAEALIDLFPDIQLDISKFLSAQSWKQKEVP